jgi:hypothetical protein
VITIEGRYAVNPLTGRTAGYLQQFVVTQASTATEIAAWPEMTIHPTLIGPGSPYQNVSSASPFEPSDVRPGYAGQFTKPIEIDWSKHISVAWEGLGS